MAIAIRQAYILGAQTRVQIEAHIPYAYMFKASKLLNKVCSIFFPWQIYFKEWKFKNRSKIIDFIWLKVGKTSKMIELIVITYVWVLYWCTGDVWMNNKIKTFITHKLSCIYSIFYFCLHFKKSWIRML